MNLTNEVILSSTTYGTASGNYDGSSQNFFSSMGRAADYYQGQGSIQTILIQVTGFSGRIRLQATLGDDPVADLVEDAWFEIYDYDHTIGTITDYHPVSITGNFVWIRAEITAFDAGTINQLTITY
jgi:hypothetical protein